MSFPLPAHWFAGSADDDHSDRRSLEHRSSRDDVASSTDLDAGIDPRLGLAHTEIAQRIRDGDARLFGHLFDAYWTPLARFAALYTRSDDEAQDVAAQVFAELWNGRAQWHPRRGIELYLYGAVRNRARNAHRAELRARRHVDELTEVGESPTAGTPQLRADETIIADERRAILVGVVNSLSDRPREILLLRWIRGLEFGEIAEVLGLSRNVVHVSYHRAIHQLRERLPAYFE